MRVLRLEAANVKKIRVIDISPKGDLVTITGPNAQGKTSALDSLLIGLVGRRAMPERTVRKGAERAEIRVTLGNGKEVELIVERTITARGGMSLGVYGPDGKEFGSPQAVLDALFGHLTFDPLHFMRLPLRDQITELRNMVPLEVNVEELNAASALDYTERTEVKKEAKRLETEAAAITVQNVPATIEDEATLRAVLRDAAATNERAAEVNRERDALVATHKAQEERAAAARTRITSLERDLQKERKILADAVKQAEEAKEQAEAIHPHPSVDIAGLTARLEQASIAAREKSKADRKNALLEQAREKRRREETLSRQIADREEAKRDALAKAKIPVEGLTFDEAEILYNGIPLAQTSSAEQIRVSVGLAMAANPKLRILRIMDGSLLDQHSIGLIAEMAADSDYQVWMECVDSSGKIGIVIEDGAVAAVNDAEGDAANEHEHDEQGTAPRTA